MGAQIYLEFKPRVSGVEFDLGGALARDFYKLDEIADANALTRLTAFADNRPWPADFAGPPEELHTVLGEWDEWFEPAEACKAFLEFVKLIQSNPKLAATLGYPEDTVAELMELVRGLTIVAEKRSKFRLVMR